MDFFMAFSAEIDNETQIPWNFQFREKNPGILSALGHEFLGRLGLGEIPGTVPEEESLRQPNSKLWDNLEL